MGRAAPDFNIFMKQGTKENLKITVFALVSAVAFFFALLLFAHYRADWGKWFGFAVWTAGIFGSLVYLYAESLDENRKCMLVFFFALALHSTMLILYLRSANKFPNVFFLLFSPIEGGIIAGVLGIFGARSFRRRTANRRPNHKWPPKT